MTATVLKWPAPLKICADAEAGAMTEPTAGAVRPRLRRSASLTVPPLLLRGRDTRR